MRLGREPVAATACVGAVTAALLIPTGFAQAAEVDLEARLHHTTAYPNARGHAGYEAGGGAREFDISVAGIRALAGHRVTVRVHGDVVGRMKVGPRGRAHLERHTGVPKMARGDVVRVRTGSGRLVTYGVLRRDSTED